MTRDATAIHLENAPVPEQDLPEALHRDIAERERTRKELAKAQARLRHLVEFSPAVLYCCDPNADYCATFVSTNVRWLLGYEPRDFIDNPRFWVEHIHPDDAPATRANVVEAIKLDYYVHEYRFRRSDGSYRWLRDEFRIVRDTSGNPIEMVGSWVDITDRRAVEEALHLCRNHLEEIVLARTAELSTANEELSTLVEAAPLAIVSLDLQGKVTSWNPAAVRIFGWTEEETLGRPVPNISPEKLTTCRRYIGRRLRGRAATSVETSAERKDGSKIEISLAVAPLHDPEENITGYLGLISDITERKQAEQALRSSAARFKTMFDDAPASMIIYDASGVILQVNQAFEQLTGYSREQVLGKSMQETVIRPGDRERMMEMIGRVMHGEAVRNVEWEAARHDQSTFYTLTNMTPLYDNAGSVESILALGVDITDRKLSEQRTLQLEESKREFYRRTIQAATEGKLAIVEKVDILVMVGSPLATWRINNGKELALVRDTVAEMAEADGMDESRIFDFVLCVGEAATNAIKHADGGTASLHRTGDGLVFVVSDKGPGIEALALPEVALRRGYTTAVSLGMGYKEMISMSDKVYLATGPGGTTVAIRMGLHPSEAPPIYANLPDAW
jgi:PAS domain S-box-containing protein